jgi:hypothetical protein
MLRLSLTAVVGLSLVFGAPVYAGLGGCATDQSSDAGASHAAGHPCCKHQGDGDAEREAKNCHCDWVASGEVGPPAWHWVDTYTAYPSGAPSERPLSLSDDLPERPPRRG